VGRAVGPIDAVGTRRQAAKWASGMSFGRAGAICEKHEFMQILPGSSTEAGLIDASATFCNREFCGKERGYRERFFLSLAFARKIGDG